MTQAAVKTSRVSPWATLASVWAERGRAAMEKTAYPSEGQAIEFELASNRGKTSAENLKVRR